jgi:hypothetical protein
MIETGPFLILIIKINVVGSRGAFAHDLSEAE